jgi:isoquinoline 1-oxidoreductase beta subunit
VTQAVLIAKQMPGTPVKLIWSREEDMLHGHYHPVMQCKLVGGFDASNNLTSLHMRLSGQSILAAVRPAIVEQQKGRDPLTFQGVADTGEHSFGYSIDNLLIDHAMRNTHVPPGFWRGSQHQPELLLPRVVHRRARAFGRPGRARIPAQADGKAPAQPRRAERGRRAGRLGQARAGGIHRGLAQMKAFNSFVAAAAEISVEGGNKIKVHRIVAATDPGYAVNPAQIERQVSGSFVYGLSALYFQECTVKNGRIEQENFNTYDSMRIRHMPKVESIIMPAGGDVWGGIGEPTICVAAPAVMNAFFSATGKRFRSVPLKNLDIHPA